MSATEAQIEEILKAVVDPHTDRDLVSGKYVKNIAVDGGRV